MQFYLTDEQTMIRDSFHRTLERACTVELIRNLALSSGSSSAGLKQELQDLGMPSLLVPEAFGGLGLRMIDAILVAEELARFVAPVPFAGNSVMAVTALTGSENEALRQEWLPKLAAGSARVAIAVAYDQPPEVTATDGHLNGTAAIAVESQGADAILLSDRKGDLFLIRADALGVSLQNKPSLEPNRQIAGLTLVNTPAQYVGDNFARHVTIASGRAALAAETLGAGEHMLHSAVTYATERKQFGRVIGSYQSIKHLCAEMAAELSTARGLVWQAALALDDCPDQARLLSMLAKSHLDEVGQKVARTAIEIHGGVGITDTLGLHHWFKRISFNRAWLGNPERVREEAARLQGLVT